MSAPSDRFQEYARLGASIRLGELQDEVRAIYKAFPALKFQKRTRPLTGRPVGDGASSEPSGEQKPRSVRHKRRKLTAAEKKFISDRMKKYWADRKAQGPTPSQPKRRKKS